MPHTLSHPAIAQDLLAVLLSEHRTKQVPRLAQLWRYYRNAIEEFTTPGTPAAHAMEMLLGGSCGTPVIQSIHRVGGDG